MAKRRSRRGRESDDDTKMSSTSEESGGSIRGIGRDYSQQLFWSLSDLTSDPDWVQEWYSGSSSTKPDGRSIPASQFSNPNLYIGSLLGPAAINGSWGSGSTEAAWIKAPIWNSDIDEIVSGTLFSKLREGITQFRTYTQEDVKLYLRVLFRALLLENASKVYFFLSTIKFPNLADLGAPFRDVLIREEDYWANGAQIESNFDVTNALLASWFLPIPLQELAFWLVQPRYLFPSPMSPIGFFGNFGAARGASILADSSSANYFASHASTIVEQLSGNVVSQSAGGSDNGSDIPTGTQYLNRQISTDIFRIFGEGSRVQVRPWRDFGPVWDPEWLTLWTNQPHLLNYNDGSDRSVTTYPSLNGTTPDFPGASSSKSNRSQGVYPMYSPDGAVSSRVIGLLGAMYPSDNEFTATNVGAYPNAVETLCFQGIAGLVDKISSGSGSTLRSRSALEQPTSWRSTYLGINMGDSSSDGWKGDKLTLESASNVEVNASTATTTAWSTITTGDFVNLQQRQLSRQMYHNGWLVRGTVNGVDHGVNGFYPARIPFEGVHPLLSSQAVMANAATAWARTLVT